VDADDYDPLTNHRLVGPPDPHELVGNVSDFRYGAG
jgi:hypothetical protein